MRDIFIERAMPSDYPEIQSLVKEANLPVENVRKLPFLVARCHGEFDESILGVIGYSAEREGWVHVRNLAVRKDSRKQGIGARLIAALVDHLKDFDDARVLIAMCMYWNIRFYKNRGFQRISTRSKQHDPTAALEEHARCTCFAMRINEPLEDVLMADILNVD